MKRLVALPFTTSFSIAFKSIRVRFFRALITGISLILAVSFLCYSQVSTDIAQGLLATGNQEYIQKLTKLGYDISLSDTSLIASAKQRWIIMLSLLVCVVGIINAQLMSVTERFREIGTMKCLGALDNFIIRIFIIEAAIQGITGSVAGALLGMVTALISSLFRFGMLPLSQEHIQAIIFSAFLSVFIGTTLSLLGVLYPSILAARMQPVEAMRVDQ